MLNVKQQVTQILIAILLALLMPVITNGVEAAPQGKELYKGEEEITVEKLEEKIERRLLQEKEGIQKSSTEGDIMAELENDPGERDKAKLKEVVVKEDVSTQEVAKKEEVSTQKTEVNESNLKKEVDSIKKIFTLKEEALEEHSKETRAKKDKPKDPLNETELPPNPSDSPADKSPHHKVKARQTLENESEPSAPDFNLSPDDLINSLIRQRNDFIAAAGVVESPRPVQTVRLNMNSGL